MSSSCLIKAVAEKIKITKRIGFSGFPKNGLLLNLSMMFIVSDIAENEIKKSSPPLPSFKIPFKRYWWMYFIKT